MWLAKYVLRTMRPSAHGHGFFFADTPAIVTVEHLHQKGWRKGPPPQRHTAISNLTYRVKCPLACKPYLQCLAVLAELLSKGLHFLESGKPAAYYKLLLVAEKPALVPLLDTAKEYKALEQGVGEITRGAPTEYNGALENGDEALVTLAVPLVEPSVDDTVTRTKQCEKTDSLPPEESAFYCFLPDRRSAGSKGLSTTGAVDESIARTSKRLRADSSARKHGEAPVHTKEKSKKQKQKQGRGKVTDVGEVEGCTLQLEEWGSVGDPDYYKRFIVTCPFHGSKDGPCEKKGILGHVRRNVWERRSPRRFWVRGCVWACKNTAKVST